MLQDVGELSDSVDEGLEPGQPVVVVERAEAASAKELVNPPDRKRKQAGFDVVAFRSVQKRLHQLVQSKCKCSVTSKRKLSCYRRFLGQDRFDQLVALRKTLFNMSKEDADKKVSCLLSVVC